MYPRDGVSAEQLLSTADHGLYEAKANRRTNPAMPSTEGVRAMNL